jgi:hypothetical protein
VSPGLRGIKRRAVAALAVLRQPPLYPPGHFYSPSTAPADREHARRWRGAEPLGIDVRGDEQLALLQQLAPAMGELRTDRRYTPDKTLNRHFGLPDAATLHAVLRHVRSRRFVEVGAGFSTAVVLDTAEEHMPELRITCIEPYPARLRSRLRPGDELTVLEQPVQSVDTACFRELEAGDILFIDSSHVAKPGSDTVHLMFHVLPLLHEGVLVHLHDIHWPFEYPERWIDQRRDWNEVYVLRALLSDSTRWRVRLMTSWLAANHPDRMPAALRCPPADRLVLDAGDHRPRRRHRHRLITRRGKWPSRCAPR